MAFRNIQPASSSQPTERAETEAIHGRQAASRPHKQACESCRHLRTKCDEKRPRCSNCATKNLDCTYLGKVGQTRNDAMRSRLEVLEKLLKSLQLSSQDRASEILEAIRDGGDIESLLQNDTASTASQSEATSSQISSREHPKSSSPVQATSKPPSRPTWPQAMSYSSTTQDHLRYNADEIIPVTGFPLKESPSPVVSLKCPDSSAMKRGIEGFFSCSGKLFHVFTAQQVAADYQMLFSDHKSDADEKSALCCIAAVAAVGFQYCHNEADLVTEQLFYDISKHYHDHLLENEPLKALKVCSLLTMYNVFGKSTVALAYVEIGLSLCKQGLVEKYDKPRNGSEEELSDYRKTRRTLVFFSSWLASTLGYIPDGDTLCAKGKMTDLDPLDPSDLSDVVQSEMAKVALLKAKIIQTQATFGDLSVLSYKTMLLDLETWYTELPKNMYLSSLNDEGVALEVRRTVYHVHLLYLGAIILLYRRMASQLIRILDGGPTLFHVNEEAFLQAFKDSHQAAQHSATLLKLMLDEDSLFKRCWLVIFQTYTTSIVLLYWMVQHKLHNIASNSMQEDLKKTRHCLEILAFCGTSDPVAQYFHRTLMPFFEALTDGRYDNFEARSPLGFSSAMIDGLSDAPIPAPTPEVADSETSLHSLGTRYFTIPPAGDEILKNQSCQLLSMLCQPFSNQDDISRVVEENLTVHSWGDPTRRDPSQLVEQFFWNTEKHIHQKGNKFLGIAQAFGLHGELQAPPNRFIGSIRPSGWFTGTGPLSLG